MSLKIVRIIDHGAPSTERVLMRATRDVNLYHYAICDNTYKSGTEELSNERRNFFWFPDVDVKKGEYVRLWTKNGKYNYHKPDKANEFFHDFYWKLSNGVWNNTGDLAVLLQIDPIDFHVVQMVK